jgi:hypothetical protein
LIWLLATDLDVEVDSLDIGTIVSRVAPADTLWKTGAMMSTAGVAAGVRERRFRGEAQRSSMSEVLGPRP